MAVRMQQRRATAEQWLLADPVLAEGEIGLETDTYSFKIGDGVNNWSLLDYFESGASLQATIDDYIPLTQKGVALGVAELDANGFVPASQLDIDVSGDINAAIAALVDSAPATLDTLNELAAALGDDANFATTITTSISSGDAATLASAQSYADQAELDAVATANAYTDAEIAAIPPVDLTGYATETYADQAEADAKTYADGLASNYDVAGSASTAESNANTYTDNLIGDGTVDGTAGNTVTDRIATAVSNLVDSAPATLDTLNELAAALGDDANFATTVTNSLAGKQDIVTGVSSTEIGYLDGVTSSIQTQLNGKAATSHTHAISDVTNLQTSLDAKALLTPSVNSKTANYTLVAGDRGEFITCDGTFTITIPSGTFGAGDRVDFVNIGTGVITFTGSGVTVNSIDSAVTIDTQWAGATFFFTSATAGVLIGKLA